MNELAEIISKNESKILPEWIRDMGNSVQRADLMSGTELEEQCRTLLSAVVSGLKISGPTDIDGAGWETARELLQRSRPRAHVRDSLRRRGDVCPFA